MKRTTQVLRHHADQPAIVVSEEVWREPPGISKLCVFAHPMLSTTILLAGFVLAAVVAG